MLIFQIENTGNLSFTKNIYLLWLTSQYIFSEMNIEFLKNTYIHMYIRMYLCILVWMYVCIHKCICIYVCINVCIYLWKCVYTYISILPNMNKIHIFTFWYHPLNSRPSAWDLIDEAKTTYSTWRISEPTELQLSFVR